MSTACELFRQHGIRGIGVDAIAEAAETNKMTLYRHFGSKDDLICETLRFKSEQASALWEELEAQHPNDPMARLHGWVKARAQCLADNQYGCDLANAAVELKEQGHPAHAVIENFKLAQRRRLEKLCCDAGVAEPELLSDTLSMLMEGAQVSKLATGSEGPSMRFMLPAKRQSLRSANRLQSSNLPHLNQGWNSHRGLLVAWLMNGRRRRSMEQNRLSLHLLVD